MPVLRCLRRLMNLRPRWATIRRSKSILRSGRP
jgi:hypothetical protein